MNKTLMIVLAVLFTVIVLPAFVLVSSYVTWANYGNRTEALIKATYSNNENILAEYGQKVAEVAQVPTMYRDDVMKVASAAIQGRYGADGSKAMFQMLREQNPTLDSSMYRQIQQVIESGRNDFQSAQTRLIDVERQYEVERGNVWSGLWIRMAGYPKLDLTKFQPITTDRAKDAFTTGVEKPIQLR